MRDASAAAGSDWSMFNQLLIQAEGLGATIAFAALGTLCICFIVEKLFRFRLDREKELTGLDQSLHGEHGYGMLQP